MAAAHNSGWIPHVPPGASGLVAAMESAHRGDEGLLARWLASGYHALVDALRRSGGGPEEADRVATAVVEKGWAAVRRGRRIENELAWMARAAATCRIDEWNRTAPKENGATAQRRNGATAQRRNGATAQRLHPTLSR